MAVPCAAAMCWCHVPASVRSAAEWTGEIRSCVHAPCAPARPSAAKLRVICLSCIQGLGHTSTWTVECGCRFCSMP